MTRKHWWKEIDRAAGRWRYFGMVTGLESLLFNALILKQVGIQHRKRKGDENK
jgi:hypothetical protein